MRWVIFLCLASAFLLAGCYSLPLDPNYPGPPLRPTEIEQYYSRDGGYGKFNATVIESHSDFTVKKVVIESKAGAITLDLFERREPSEHIVLVFPLLKGKPIVENHFARYFAQHGLDAVIVHRQGDFQDPKNIDRLEEIFHDNVVRDRYVLDYLHDNHGKRQFGSFGISRGAINAAITAGVDARLKHNVLVLGGSDLPKLYEKSNQGRIRRFVASVTSQKQISNSDFYNSLRHNLRSDPKYLASFIDARHTLMFLGVFDQTVPIRYGRLLRKQIGNPKTIFLLAEHYTSLAFTGILCSFLPEVLDPLCILPLDYIETEALHFYRTSMQINEPTLKILPYRLMRTPFDIVGKVAEEIF